MRIYGILVILAVLLAACQSVPPAEQAMAEKEVAADAGAAAVEEAVAEDVVIEDQAEGAMIEKSGSAIAIQDRTVSPAELSVAAGTEVAISVSGPTTHIIVIRRCGLHHRGKPGTGIRWECSDLYLCRAG